MKLVTGVKAFLLLTALVSAVSGVDLGGQNVPRDKAQAFLFIGHSNMAGRYLRSVDFEVNSSRIWMYRGAGYSKAKEPYSNDPNFGGPCNFFLERMLQHYPDPGTHFIVLNNGQTQRRTGDYKRGGGNYNQIVGWANNIKNEVTIAGVFVLLGYMERGDNETTFRNNALAVIDDIRNGLGMPSLPFIWGACEESMSGSQVCNAISSLPSHRSNVWVNTVRGPCGQNGPTDKDRCNGGNHHFNWYGYQAWGHRLADMVKSNNLVGPSTPTIVDETPPTAPGNLRLVSKTASSLQLQWDASTDNVGVTGYIVYTGSTQAATVTTTSAQLSGLQASTDYTITVKARDAANNLSGPSNALTVTTGAPAPAQPVAIPFRLNIGGTTSSDDLADKQWGDGGDYGYTVAGMSGSSTMNVQGATSATTPVYQTCRYQNFSYTIAIPNGMYRVTMMFADFWRETAGERTFTISLNGSSATSSPIDIVGEVGKAAAHTVSKDLSVSGERITITATGVVGDPLLNGLYIEELLPTATAARSPADRVARNAAVVHFDIRGRKYGADAPLGREAFSPGAQGVYIVTGPHGTARRTRMAK